MHVGVGVTVVLMVMVGGCGGGKIVPQIQAANLQQTLEALVPKQVTFGAARGILAAAGFAMLHAALIGQAVLKKDRIAENFYEDYYAYDDDESARKSYYARPPYHMAPLGSFRASSSRHQKRSVSGPPPEDALGMEMLLLSSLVRLDRDKCVMKLLCLLDNKATDARTLEENVLLQVFSNNSETLVAYNDAFVAARKDGHSLEQPTCDQVFPSCAVEEGELGGLLRQSWDAVDNFV